jgi:hypothetical protein
VILRVCDRFHCTPDVAERQDASVLRLLEIDQLTRPDQSAEGGEY